MSEDDPQTLAIRSDVFGELMAWIAVATEFIGHIAAQEGDVPMTPSRRAAAERLYEISPAKHYVR